MKCPNCRCEIDIRSEICPYCGVALYRTRKVSQEYQKDRIPSAPSARKEQSTQSTNKSKDERLKNRENSHGRRVRQPDQGKIYQEILILIGIGLLLVNLMELIAMIGS